MSQEQEQEEIIQPLQNEQPQSDDQVQNQELALSDHKEQLNQNKNDAQQEQQDQDNKNSEQGQAQPPVKQLELAPHQEKPQKLKTTTERSFKTIEQVYSSKPRLSSSMQFFRSAQQFDTKVVHDQINRSNSKQQYTFSKAERFSKPRKSYCSTQFYDCQIRSAMGTRSAALGFGNKSDFTKHDKYIPGPTAYTISAKAFKGVKFAFGRNETAPMGIHGNKNRKNNPAPNHYMVDGLKKNDLKYSFGERTKAKHIYLESKTPAPGTYNVGGFSRDGACYFSRYRSSGAPVISPASQQSTRCKRIPGPGTYDPPGDIADLRNYWPSKYMNRSAYSFGIQQRVTQEIRNKQYPGPGSYQLPSEFGDFEYPP